MLPGQAVAARATAVSAGRAERDINKSRIASGSHGWKTAEVITDEGYPISLTGKCLAGCVSLLHRRSHHNQRKLEHMSGNVRHLEDGG